jgi:hypothetical protein
VQYGEQRTHWDNLQAPLPGGVLPRIPQDHACYVAPIYSAEDRGHGMISRQLRVAARLFALRTYLPPLQHNQRISLDDTHADASYSSCERHTFISYTTKMQLQRKYEATSLQLK